MQGGPLFINYHFGIITHDEPVKGDHRFTESRLCSSCRGGYMPCSVCPDRFTESRLCSRILPCALPTSAPPVLCPPLHSYSAPLCRLPGPLPGTFMYEMMLFRPESLLWQAPPCMPCATLSHAVRCALHGQHEENLPLHVPLHVPLYVPPHTPMCLCHSTVAQAMCLVMRYEYPFTAILWYNGRSVKLGSRRQAEASVVGP